MRAQPLPRNQRDQLVEIVEDHDVSEVCEASGLTENALVRAIAGLPLLPRTRRRVHDALSCFDANDAAAGEAGNDDEADDDEADDDDDEVDDEVDDEADDDDDDDDE